MAVAEKAHDESILKTLASIGMSRTEELRTEREVLLLKDPALAKLSPEEREKVRKGLRDNARLLGFVV